MDMSRISELETRLASFYMFDRNKDTGRSPNFDSTQEWYQAPPEEIAGSMTQRPRHLLYD